MDDEASVALAEVEAVPVVSDNDVCFVQKAPDVPHEGAVVLRGGLIPPIMGEAPESVPFLPGPLVREAENVPVGLNVDDGVLFISVVEPSETGSCFYVVEEDFGFQSALPE